MRGEVKPFTDKQIALVTNFAAQAVIAIENARLLNELRQSLEQQTATSQVLQVISSSTGDLEHVFATMLENATRICEAKFGALYLSEGDGFRATAMHNAPPAYEEARAGVLHPPPSTSLWRAANTKQAVQIADVRSERGYVERDPFVVSAVALGGYRSVLSVPMLHEDELVGVITIFRQEVRPFTDEQISLVQNSAAQAVIAIENARLLNELRQRTTDLTEALEQQTATSEVLQVISSSSGFLRRSSSMLEKAIRICDAALGIFTDGREPCASRCKSQYAASLGRVSQTGIHISTDNPFAIATMIYSKAPSACDRPSSDEYTLKLRSAWGNAARFLAVPMLNGDDLIGASISIARKFVLSLINRSGWCIISLLKQLLP